MMHAETEPLMRELKELRGEIVALRQEVGGRARGKRG
jgi:hypothetical protein